MIEISEKAFHGCKKLQRICFKASISEFKNWFDDCESLNELFISDCVKTFSNKALCGCSKLQKISVDENSKNISEKDSILYSYDQTILLRCPPGLKTDNINIFQDVTKIANGAFSGGINLKSITLPMGVNVIGYDAFEKCTQLSDIFIPSSVSIIGTSAFNGCVNLTNIKIPISISRIDDFIFSGCANLTDVVYDGTKEQWKEASFSILKNRSPLPFVVHCCDGDLTL